MSGYRTLPARPNLGHQRKQAKALLKALRAGDAAAWEWFRAGHPRAAAIDAPALAEVQYAHARDHGFASWPRMKRHIEALTGADRVHRSVMDTDLQYFRDRAAGLSQSLGDGEPGALRLVARHHPAFAGRGEAAVAAAVADGRIGAGDCKTVVARSHGFDGRGFDGWPAFAAHVGAVAAGRVRVPFLDAVAAIKAGDTAGLAALLDADPALVNAPGTNGNRLANVAVNQGAADAFDLLVARGADVDLGNDKGWTPLHDAAYGTPHRESVADLALLEAVLAAGASPEIEARGTGGTPLAVALFWGHRALAERLAEETVVPLNLRVAAGLGRRDLLDRLVAADGTLAPGAGRARGFHRPHGGFPPWRPSDAPQEIRDEALVWAAKAGRVEAMALLADRGGDLDGEPCNGRALHWAAANQRWAAIDWLLDHGAEIDGRAGFGGLRGVTALQVASAWDGRPDSVARLLARGADIWPRDPLYGATAAGFAGHFGNRDIERTILESRADTDLMAAVLLDDGGRVARHLAADPGAAARRGETGLLPADAAAQAERPAALAALLAAGAPRDPVGTTVTAPAVRSGAGDGSVLHIRCGSDIFAGLDEAGVPGDRLEWGDPICCGPLPPDLDGDALTAVRARFIAEEWGAARADEVRDAFRRQSDALDAAGRYRRLILWFEHDLYDQSVLVQLLPALDARGLIGRSALLSLDRHPEVPRFLGFGQLSPAQLAALVGRERPVTAEQVAAARAALAGFRAAAPTALAAIAAAPNPLPFLPGALGRHLAELPGTRDGLGLTERLILGALAEGIDTPGRAFGALMRRLDPQPYLGDLMAWPVIRRMAEAHRPAITPVADWRSPVTLTDYGRALVAGEADWPADNPLDRWVGGVHLTGRWPAWRHDGTGVVRA